MTKTYFRECRWLILIYSFMEANRNNCRFSGISHHLFFSGYVDGPIYNWILFHNKYRLRQLLNMNTCTIFTQQRMCRCFLCWIFSLSPSRSLPRLIPSLVCVRGDRPLGTNSMDSLKPGCQLGLAPGEPWLDITESEVVRFISLSARLLLFILYFFMENPSSCQRRWPSLPLTALSLGADDHSFPLPAPTEVLGGPRFPWGTSLSLLNIPLKIFLLLSSLQITILQSALCLLPTPWPTQFLMSLSSPLCFSAVWIRPLSIHALHRGKVVPLNVKLMLHKDTWLVGSWAKGESKPPFWVQILIQPESMDIQSEARRLPLISSCPSRGRSKSSLSADVSHHDTLFQQMSSFFLWSTESMITWLPGTYLSTSQGAGGPPGAP